MSNTMKNIIIGVLIILFLGACGVIFYLTTAKDKNIMTSITGKVIVSDSAYVIIEADNEDYLVSDIKGTYNVGDEVKFSYMTNDLNEEEMLKTIKIKDEEIIKVNYSEENNSNKEENDNNSNTINTDKNTSNDNKTNSITNNQTNNTIKDTDNKTSSNIKTEENTSNSTDKNTTNSDNNTNLGSEASADVQVLSYFNDLKSDVDAATIKDSAKNGFITVVDFLFYGGEIKGYTFNELSTSAKLKVLSLGLYIDTKIEKYFPNYKESISNTTSKVYTNVKEKIVTAYLELTTSICTSNNALCTDAKEGFMELKNNFGLTWSLIKDVAGEGLANLKSWYEIWSGK